MKPLVLALILGGIVGAGGAAAFAVTSFSGQPSTQLEQPAAQTSSAIGARVRGPGGHVVDDRPVCFAERVLVGAVHVAAGQHVLVADRAPLHDARHVDDTADVHVDVHVGFGFGIRVRIDLFVRAREHVLVSSAALVDPASSSSRLRRSTPASPPSSAPSS